MNSQSASQVTYSRTALISTSVYDGIQSIPDTVHVAVKCFQQLIKDTIYLILLSTQDLTPTGHLTTSQTSSCTWHLPIWTTVQGAS